MHGYLVVEYSVTSLFPWPTHNINAPLLLQSIMGRPVCSAVNYGIQYRVISLIEKRSWVWEHFILHESKDNAICKLCPVGTSSIT